MNKDNLNPFKSSHIQALLDLINAGFEVDTLKEIVEKLNNNEDVRKTAMDVWNKRAYSEDSIQWAQLYKYDSLMNLTSNSIKLLIFLGLHSGQSGYVKVSVRTLCNMTKIDNDAITKSLQELRECGCIRYELEPKGSRPAIYQINPKVINIGRKKSAFEHSNIEDINYILNRAYEFKNAVDLQVLEDKIIDEMPDGSHRIYNELRLDLTKKESSEVAKQTEDSNNC